MTSRLRSWTLRRVLFGWLYALIGPPGQRTGIYAIALLTGLMSLVSLVFMLSRAPERWGTIKNLATTMSVDVECERLVTGGTYFIVVDDKRYECTGADSWCPYMQPVEVVYDRAQPSHCRFARNQGRPSKWELAALLNSFSGVLLGFGVWLIRPDDTHRRRSALGHVLFVLCVAILLASWWAGLSTMA